MKIRKNNNESIYAKHGYVSHKGACICYKQMETKIRTLKSFYSTAMDKGQSIM